jgi:hypothetical protein
MKTKYGVSLLGGRPSSGKISAPRHRADPSDVEKSLTWPRRHWKFLCHFLEDKDQDQGWFLLGPPLSFSPSLSVINGLHWVCTYMVLFSLCGFEVPLIIRALVMWD